MANTTYASHAQVQSDSGNDFLHYVDTSGKPLFTIDKNGNLATIGGVAGTGTGVDVVVYALNASIGFAAFNTAAAVSMQPTTVPTGVYRVSLYMVTTTTFLTSTQEVITFGWTDAQGARTVAYTSASEAAGTVTTGSQLIQVVTGAAVTYTPSVTGSAATAGVMSVSIILGRLA